MNTVEFDLGNGAIIALPADVVTRNLLNSMRKQTKPAANRFKIGEYLPGQGGIYLGDILGDDCVLYGLIGGEEMDIGTAEFGNKFKGDLSQWDGLSNTNALRGKSPAADMAAKYERDGHCDFYLPARRELMVPLANTPHLFNKDGWYLSSTPRGDSYVWAVDFGRGSVYYGLNRLDQFLVRPFRRFTH